jgi:hypothetical protein
MQARTAAVTAMANDQSIHIYGPCEGYPPLRLGVYVLQWVVQNDAQHRSRRKCMPVVPGHVQCREALRKKLASKNQLQDYNVCVTHGWVATGTSQAGNTEFAESQLDCEANVSICILQNY